MSKYKDHREPRRHRHDDDPASFAERPSEPSYFQRSSTLAASAVDAEVMWFNTSKGFGFVKLPEGTQAYLHIRVLEAAGSRGVSEGTRLKVTTEESPRGHQVAQVLEVGGQTAKPQVQYALRWRVHRRDERPVGERGHGQMVQSPKGLRLHCT
ncbi:cold shock domain-containing protein [Mesorhizobium sp. NZP2077]|uniref:cold-shock protein n=1 Tax=Mesorhizobium sp. NZP2077 TaxID=2483404 RepID=UPI001555A9BB|nr:cold shock domain-containing protein [Mesorhizobium sp. NZP2077]QKD19570.1 cold shock domain-containing protein [Mesorhizobium sp. NZP2077]